MGAFGQGSSGGIKMNTSPAEFEMQSRIIQQRMSPSVMRACRNAAWTLRWRLPLTLTYPDAETNVVQATFNALEGSLPSNVASTDIEALAFVVLMEATQSAQEDLKSIMDQVKAINAAKENLRLAMEEAANLSTNNDGSNKLKYRYQRSIFRVPK
jgi:hypothetical protein